MRRTLTPRALWTLVAVAALWSAAAGAEEPRCGARPWVRITGASGDGFLALLRAELGPHGIDACAEPQPGAPEPIATVVLTPSEERVVIDVEVRDAITAKRVSREIDLTQMPADGRPLALALAIDELLQASWAELALPTAPPPPVPVPPQVRERIDTALRLPPRPRARTATLGLAFGVEHYGGGQSHFGPDVRGALWLLPRFALTLRAGFRSGLAVASADGDVRSSAVLFGAGAAWTLTQPAQRAGIDAIGSFDVERVSYFAVPKAGASASSGADVALLGSLGARAWLRVGPPWRLAVDVLAIAPLRTARAADAGTVVTAVSGLGISAALAIEGDL